MERDTKQRNAPLEMDPEEFRELGHNLINQLADFLASLRELPVTPGESSEQVRQAMGAADSLPEQGADPEPLLDQTARLLLDHSLFNGHPASGATSLHRQRLSAYWVSCWQQR